MPGANTRSEAQAHRTPQVAILLCTYQGERHLREQLESYRAQTYTHWRLHASDDGSTDGTCAILEEYQKRWPPGRMTIYQGPVRGYVANFLSLACHASIQADYYAFSDQDDIWEADKLQRAVTWLNQIPPHVPALYCSRTRLIDEAGHPIGLSPRYPRRPSFANALVQNIVSGNTLVFNAAARALLTEAGNDVDVVVHDWWAYLLITGCGGSVYFDDHPTVRYRQHGRNQIGANLGLAGRLQRLRMMLRGRFQECNERNLAALQRMRSRLTPENRQILDQFSTARTRGLIPRVIGICSSGVYRQSLTGHMGLILAAILKRI